MTEFTGLDLEMAFEEHYHEVLDTLDNLFLNIFKGLKETYAGEIETIMKQYPHEEFLVPDKTVRLNYAEGIKLLREAGVEIGDQEDMKCVSLIFLGLAFAGLANAES
jgi:aspartyl/asparaginyl-tRNA synthetase